MWAVMMVGMMLPSASPMLLLYQRRRATLSNSRTSAASRWSDLYALAAAPGGVGLVQPRRNGPPASPGNASVRLADDGGHKSRRRRGAVADGGDALTPIKHACLQTCQSPLGFLMSRWRSGLAGAFRMGLEHGAVCVGCCWALMLLLFVGEVVIGRHCRR